MGRGDNPLGIWFPTVRAGTGADVFAVRLAEGLQRRGVRAEITWLPHRAEYAPWSVAAAKPPSWASVVHINTWLHPRFYAGTGLPILATCHGCVHDPALEPYKSRAQAFYHRHLVRPIEKHSLATAVVVTAVSLYTAEKVTQAFGRKGIEVIANWLPDDAFVRNGREAPNEPFRLLYVGNWSSRKGSDLLPAIIGELGPEFELQFTGVPPKHTRLPQNMVSLGWSSEPSRVREWMWAADALMFPSRMEGMPLAVLEAMACGLPIIASDTSSLPELIADGRTGLLCPVDDVHAFANAVQRLRGSPTEWKAMGNAAYAWAKAYHSESVALDNYLALYRSLRRTGTGNKAIQP